MTLRRVGDLEGAGVDAVLARAERQVDDGDLDRPATVWVPDADEVRARELFYTEREGEL